MPNANRDRSKLVRSLVFVSVDSPCRFLEPYSSLRQGLRAQVAPEGEEAPETTAEPAAKLDPDSDEIREKFRIVRVRRLSTLSGNPDVP